jgi:hypothetical protein
MAIKIYDREGSLVEVPLNGMALHREAADKRLSFRQLVNMKFPTAADKPETFKQMCASAGMRFKADPETGQPASTIREMLDPISYEAANGTGGTYTSNPMIPDSRILFAPAVMAAVEDAMQTKEGDATSAFDSIVGLNTTVASNRIEQPVISYGGNGGPEDAAFQRIAQNSRPPIMLSLTASDISRRIPTTSIGMEISDEAMNNGMDFLARTFVRFYKKADYVEWISQIGYILSGNADGAVTPMDDGTAALVTFTAQSLDATITTAGTLTQKAWLAYFYKNTMEMTPDVIVCDFASAMAIENRTGRPTNVMNNSMDRLDRPFSVIYPSLVGNVNLLVMPTGTFPANTLMGLQKADAIAKVTSSTAAYEATERLIMKKSTEVRVDRGFITYRQYADAFSVMTLTV